jgi:hypothetical protein
MRGGPQWWGLLARSLLEVLEKTFHSRKQVTPWAMTLVNPSNRRQGGSLDSNTCYDYPRRRWGQKINGEWFLDWFKAGLSGFQPMEDPHQLAQVVVDCQISHTMAHFA